MTESMVAGASGIDLDEVYLPDGSMRQLSRAERVDGETIRGEVDLTHHWAFQVHFPGDPVYPGCLMIEAAGQLVATHAWLEHPHGRPRLVKTRATFREPVEPGDGVMSLSATIRRRRNLYFGNVRLTAGGREVAEVEIALAIIDQA